MGIRNLSPEKEESLKQEILQLRNVGRSPKEIAKIPRQVLVRKVR